MNCYLFDDVTFEYLNATETSYDPVDMKVLLPRNATTLKPDDVEFGKVAIYNKSRKKWDTMIDHRGEWYDLANGNKVEIKTLYDTSAGDSLEDKIPYTFEFKVLKLRNGQEVVRENPANHYTGLDFELLEWDFYSQKFEPKKDLTLLLTELKDSLKAEYKSLCDKDIEFQGIKFQADSDSINSMNMKLSFKSTKTSLKWILSDNSYVDITLDDLSEILAKIEARNDILFEAYQDTKRDLLDCKDYETLGNFLPNWVEIVNHKLRGERQFMPLYDKVKKLDKEKICEM